MLGHPAVQMGERVSTEESSCSTCNASFKIERSLGKGRTQQTNLQYRAICSNRKKSSDLVVEALLKPGMFGLVMTSVCKVSISPL